MTGKSMQALEVNRKLDKMRVSISKHYQEIMNRDNFVTADKVKNAFLGLEYRCHTLMKVYTQSRDEIEKQYKAGVKKARGVDTKTRSTIQNGGVLIIDEFGASLHTQLSVELLKLFYSTMNVLGAQLIITTHDTNLLRKDLLRRDQIWFAEKSAAGASDLYSLVEYKINQANSVRNDASFSKDYLLGRYGAIPYFGKNQ